MTTRRIQPLGIVTVLVVLFVIPGILGKDTANITTMTTTTRVLKGSSSKRSKGPSSDTTSSSSSPPTLTFWEDTSRDVVENNATQVGDMIWWTASPWYVPITTTRNTPSSSSSKSKSNKRRKQGRPGDSPTEWLLVAYSSGNCTVTSVEPYWWTQCHYHVEFVNQDDNESSSSEDNPSSSPWSILQGSTLEYVGPIECYHLPHTTTTKVDEDDETPLQLVANFAIVSGTGYFATEQPPPPPNRRHLDDTTSTTSIVSSIIPTQPNDPPILMNTIEWT